MNALEIMGRSVIIVTYSVLEMMTNDASMTPTPMIHCFKEKFWRDTYSIGRNPEIFSK
ncbi:MAG: hypothetical protein GWO20_16465 [Candidatus Korarchaeota archaeon]|nr:hypothetical protein [Candidatus Korarchaeota archaeon]NIU85096.1 hypothetical protein [Candidatus Thorarchaeota archaeon]NIW15023.1 hypothetical protein [Candidatus Thorarchaeota archaeon]NIW53033.1 hypothetical protein [Candidatus Korarchaeota archaeon]